MKIKAKNPKNSSMQLIVPVDGLITIDANGVTDVSAKCAAVALGDLTERNACVVHGSRHP